MSNKGIINELVEQLEYCIEMFSYCRDKYGDHLDLSEEVEDIRKTIEKAKDALK